MARESFVHAAQFLKANDPDRYFASLVVPERARAPIQALYAFNADVATVRDRAREPAPGEIRLQWWVDAIKGEGHGGVRQNPIADAVLETIERKRLPSGALLRLIAARRFDLYDDAMPDLQGFEGYAGETVSVLYQLAAMILQDGGELASGDAAGHLGVGHALIGHLRAFGYHASRGRIMLPWAVFAANGVTEAEIFSGTVSEGVLAAHAQLVDMARDHLSKAKRAIGDLPKQVRPAFAMITLLSSQLRDVVARSETPYAPPREIADWRKIAALGLWGARNG